VIVIAGLAFEARIAAASGLQVICSGDGKDLAAKISCSITRDCRGLISFGVSGGLSPHLAPGTCIIGSSIVSSAGIHVTDPAWSRRLLDLCPNPVYGALLGVPEPISNPEVKRSLHRKTGAIAVDMESHIVAGVAAARGLPMAAIRVVTDPADRAIPETAIAAMRADGSVDMRAMLRSLFRSPRDLTDMLRLAFDARAARSTLRRSRHALVPRGAVPERHNTEVRRTEKIGNYGVHRTNPAPHGFMPYLPTANLLTDPRAFQKAD
jgi:hopanoid-associated phosphorylase